MNIWLGKVGGKKEKEVEERRNQPGTTSAKRTSHGHTVDGQTPPVGFRWFSLIFVGNIRTNCQNGFRPSTVRHLVRHPEGCVLFEAGYPFFRQFFFQANQKKKRYFFFWFWGVCLIYLSIYCVGSFSLLGGVGPIPKKLLLNDLFSSLVASSRCPQSPGSFWFWDLRPAPASHESSARPSPR